MDRAICNNYPSNNKNVEQITIRKTKKKTGLRYGYKDIKPNIDGWIDANRYLPPEYELCHLKTQNKKCKGWHTGRFWDGLGIKESDNVLYWKRIKDE